MAQVNDTTLAGRVHVRALMLLRPAGTGSLQWRELPENTPGPSEVVVTSVVTGVCHHDVIASRGGFSRTAFPAVLGHEVAGDVLHVGKDVGGVSPGDRVVVTTIANCGSCNACRTGREQLCARGGVLGETIPGGYAERVVVPEWCVIPIPDGVSYAQAAVTPCALGTAYGALARLSLPRGATVLVTGASGGLGLHAIMLARAKGLQVIAVTTSVRKTAALEAAGADIVVVTDKDGRYAAACRAHRSGGVDAVLEVTSQALCESLRSLKPRGRVVMLGNVGEASTVIEPAMLILKELTVTGSRGASRDEIEHLLDMIVSGQIAPHVTLVGDADAIPDIHRSIANRELTGKAVVKWRDDVRESGDHWDQS